MGRVEAERLSCAEEVAFGSTSNAQKAGAQVILPSVAVMKIEIVFTHDPIAIPLLALPSREIGACVEFQGIVRELEGEKTLSGLFYEAYEAMARPLLERHFAELASLHPCDEVLFIHRLGWVPAGEASLYVRVLSAHRGEGLKFLSDAIDRLKKDVPIWKRLERAS
jgi:molybdopterin synthase catalytic subunit